MAPELILAPVIVFVASVVEAAFGFGGGITAIPLLSLMIGLHDSVTLFLVFQFFKGSLLIPGWRHVAWGKIRLVMLALPFGVALGMLCLTLIDARWLEFLLGIYLLLYVAADLLKLKGVTFRPPALHQLFMGAGGGFIQGIIGTGGPFLVTYVRGLNLGKDGFRFTIVALLFIANAIRLVLTTSAGLFNHHVLVLLAACLPAYGFALVAGYRLPKFLTHRQFSLIINILLVMSGIALLSKVH